MPTPSRAEHRRICPTPCGRRLDVGTTASGGQRTDPHVEGVIIRVTDSWTRSGFRTPTTGPPIHVDLVLDEYRLGLATETSTREDHGPNPVADGHRAAVILWTDDAPASCARLVKLGATPVKSPAPWLDRLLIAWVEDLDGHLVQVVQAVS